MEKSKNEKVQQFLEIIMKSDNEQFKIILKLREIVFENYPNANERMMYGGIMFALDDDFGGVFANKNHISFEFGKGFTMKRNLLQICE